MVEKNTRKLGRWNEPTSVEAYHFYQLRQLGQRGIFLVNSSNEQRVKAQTIGSPHQEHPEQTEQTFSVYTPEGAE
jgi:hypothetical protein